MSSDQMGFDLVGRESVRPRKQNIRLPGDTLFIGARPDRAAAAAAQAIARDCRDLYHIDRQPLADRRLHVSLLGIERAPVLNSSLIYDARAAIDSLRFDPFEISLDSVTSFGRGASRPIVLAASMPNTALRSVLLRLADKLDGLGVPCSLDPHFLAHMTLIYYDKPITSERLKAPISWIIDRLWLIRSRTGQGSYEFLWPQETFPDV